MWDRAGLVISVSATWTALLSLPLAADRWLPRSAGLWSVLLTVALLPIILAVPTAGIFAVARRLSDHREARYSGIWRDGWRLRVPALKLSLLQAAISTAGVTAFLFYLRAPFWPGRIVAALSGYLLLLWTMMLIYQWPLLIAQETGLLDDPDRRATRGARAAVRRSFFLALGRPFTTLAVLAIGLLVTAALAATLALPALVWIGACAIGTTRVVDALLIDLGALPAPVQQSVVPDEQFRIVFPDKLPRRDEPVVDEAEARERKGN